MPAYYVGPEPWTDWARWIVVDVEGCTVACSHKPLLDANGYVSNRERDFRMRDLSGVKLPEVKFKTNVEVARTLIFQRQAPPPGGGSSKRQGRGVSVHVEGHVLDVWDKDKWLRANCSCGWSTGWVDDPRIQLRCEQHLADVATQAHEAREQMDAVARMVSGSLVRAIE